MKKLARFLCALLIVCLLAGCGKEKEPEPSTEQTTEAETTQEETTEATTQAVEEDVTEKQEESGKKDILIAIDPGHQGSNVDMSALEPNAPGSSEMKKKASTGTQGTYTGVPEYQLALDISLKLRDALQEQGYQVIMTREDNDTAISNSERAQLANQAGANVMIRIHANGSEDHSVNGALALVGSSDNPYVGGLYESSYAIGKTVLDSYCTETGMANLGMQTNDTMTGINWSQVPVFILEMGFMTNEQDDRNMQDPDYQQKMVQGIVNGLNAYYGDQPAHMTDLEETLAPVVQQERDKGSIVSAYVVDLQDDAIADLSQGQMQSASLIKLYIAGCVYEQYDAVKAGDSYAGETDELLKQMITVSDNDAANTLVKRLGNGDAAAGMQKVNAFCEAHNYGKTHMGRLMLDFGASDDNYTSVGDCCNYLKAVYRGELAGSESILELLKQQERTGKIPAGVPDGVVTANKTGELEDVENDAAIVYTDKGDYLICVLTANVADTASAREMIKTLSAKTYEYYMNR